MLKQARFFISVARFSELPPARAEVAFAGRSNAGKSSAINLLANQNRLAFTSKTPGRTQLINFFELAPETYLVDLPGYGYAKVPPAIRAQWEGLLSRYLQERAPLAGMVLIMDARHPLTELDRRMLDWFTPTGKPVHILLSKSDKLSNNEKVQTLRRVREALVGLPTVSVQLFSSHSRQGADEAAATVEGWLKAEVQIQKSLGQGEAEAESAPRGSERPAQGGEAGDDNSASAVSEHPGVD